MGRCSGSRVREEKLLLQLHRLGKDYAYRTLMLCLELPLTMKIGIHADQLGVEVSMVNACSMSDFALSNDRSIAISADWRLSRLCLCRSQLVAVILGSFDSYCRGLVKEKRDTYLPYHRNGSSSE